MLGAKSSQQSGNNSKIQFGKIISTNYTFFSPYINIVDELNVTCITG